MEIFGRYTAQFVNRVIDEANVFVIFTDSNGDITVCNKKVELIAAKPKEEITGKNWLSVLYPDNNNVGKPLMFKAVMDDSVNYKRPNNFEGIIIDKDKNERLISWNITPILKNAGELEGVLLIGSDITALVEVEATRRKIDETLQNIFSSIKDYALYVINLDGNITYFGMAAETMFGWQKNEIIFKDVNQLHKNEDVQEKLPAILQEVRQRGQYETEIELINKGGQGFPVILSVSRFLDAEGQLTGYIFFAKDITERKRLEYQMLQSEKLAAIGQLSAGIAHEINNPLFVISGRLEMILEQSDLNQKLRETLVIMNSQVERIRKLVDQLLKFSRKTPPKLETINLNEVIEGVLPLLSYHKLPASAINIVKDLNTDIPSINGDLNQLQEVFLNLFINAYQSMQNGGTLTVKTDKIQGKQVEIKITDTGCGILQDNLKNIFMPFFSTKKEGTGLGLPICYNIIKNHNGTVDVESQLNKGTSFIVKLPFA